MIGKHSKDWEEEIQAYGTSKGINRQNSYKDRIDTPHGGGSSNNPTKDITWHKTSPIRYKETVSGWFYTEKIVEDFLGDPQYIYTFHTKYLKKGKSFDDLEILKDCKYYGHHVLDYKEDVDRLYIGQDFILRLTINYQGGYSYINSNIKHSYAGTLFARTKNANTEELEKAFNSLLKKEKPAKEKGSINILVKEGKDLVLKPVEKQHVLDLTNYNNDFVEVHEKVISLLQGDKGIFLFYGVPGTGKTSYIKCLPKFVKNKKFIFIPPAYGEVLSTPEFLTFMLNHKNSILIIEDAETILKSRKAGSNHAVSNILNLTDGILAEMLNIQIICTLNCNINQIDEAILRPGRLMLDYNFDKLDIERANSKLSELFVKEEYYTNKSLTLAEIYTYNKSQPKEEKTIGFRR